MQDAIALFIGGTVGVWVDRFFAKRYQGYVDTAVISVLSGFSAFCFGLILEMKMDLAIPTLLAIASIYGIAFEKSKTARYLLGN